MHSQQQKFVVLELAFALQLLKPCRYGTPYKMYRCETSAERWMFLHNLLIVSSEPYDVCGTFYIKAVGVCLVLTFGGRLCFVEPTLFLANIVYACSNLLYEQKFKVQHIFRKLRLVLCSLIYNFKCSLKLIIKIDIMHWNSFLLLLLMKCYIRMLLLQLLRTSYQVLESKTQHLTSYFDELSTTHFKDWLQRLKTLPAIFCCHIQMVWQKSCQSSIVSFLCIACGWGYKKYRDSKMQICSICSPIWDTPIALFYWDIYVNEIKFDIEVCRLSTL